MLFLPKTNRMTATFAVMDEREQSRMEEILNDPRNRVLSKRWIQHTETETQGRGQSTSTTQPVLYVEYEQCDL